jgi:uncharacterized protein
MLKEKIPYTGAELAPHWISGKTGVFASGIVAFRGPCRVETGELVDLEDSREGETIVAAEMLHFLGEWFDGGLDLAVARQRLLIAGFLETLAQRVSPENARYLRRNGNDLFLVAPGAGPRKLSVSIVTATPVSTLFHFGVNIDPAGAPVNAVGLAELGVNPEELAADVLLAWREEWDSMAKARCKVLPR